jgi:probable rRNA maturation factor
MKLVLTLQNEGRLPAPAAADFRRWLRAALRTPRATVALTVRIVGEAESAELNGRFRDKHDATNVLSFPAEAIAGIPAPELGDLVICAPVVIREAAEQGKTVEAHWAHMTVHGLLHLRGYDHQTEQEAERMERLETGILERLGYPDPYLCKEQAA